MADAGAPLTSSQLAAMMQGDASAIRRTLGGLRELGYVKSEKGHAGGWQINCDLNKVTLLDVYVALGSPTIIAVAPRDKSTK
ncbi:Rrf2 family transcriptional regulator, partial [Klebsiella pneumoniae]|uniref:Rrf2 family transcriptional regulator n=1 Tax=Klebsiella pneumoniae TaxID=573 RepID=UPI003B97E162